nr:catalase family protein [Aureimonas populi]
MRRIVEITSTDYGHAVRSVHAKAHGLLVGEFEVLGGLCAELRQGLFSQARTYPVILRFSTNPGDLLDDSVTTPRGLAIKVVGVEGERLPGAEGERTQDFVTVNGPAFVAPTAAAFLKNLKLLSRTTDQPQILKKVLSAALRGAESTLEAVGGESATLKALGGHPDTHILGETFFTQAPILFGRYMAKLTVVPVSPGLKALKDAPVHSMGRPDALREAVQAFFERGEGVWEVRAQLLTDPKTMPLEDASVVWPQTGSPYLPVARIRVASQDSWSEERARKLDDGLAFSPWHTLAAHRPLGSIMRVRKPSYEMSAAFRGRFNGCPIHEPARREDIGV